MPNRPPDRILTPSPASFRLLHSGSYACLSINNSMMAKFTLPTPLSRWVACSLIITCQQVMAFGSCLRDTFHFALVDQAGNPIYPSEKWANGCYKPGLIFIYLAAGTNCDIETQCYGLWNLDVLNFNGTDINDYVGQELRLLFWADESRSYDIQSLAIYLWEEPFATIDNPCYDTSFEPAVFGATLIGVARIDHNFFNFPFAPMPLIGAAQANVSFFQGGDSAGGNISYDVNDAQRHVRAYKRDGTLRVEFLTDVSGDSWAGVNTGIAGNRPCIRYSKTNHEQRLLLYYDSGGNIYRTYSEDEGTTWAMPTTIAAGTHVTGFKSRHKTELIYWRDGAAIKGKIYDDVGNVLVDTFTVVGSGVDDDALAAYEHVRAGGEWHVKLLYTSGGNIVSIDSTDGVNFN